MRHHEGDVAVERMGENPDQIEILTLTHKPQRIRLRHLSYWKDQYQ